MRTFFFQILISIAIHFFIMLALFQFCIEIDAQGQKNSKAVYGDLNSSKNRTKITILYSVLSTEAAFFGRIENNKLAFEID